MCSKSNLTTSDTQDKRRRARREVYSGEGYKVYSTTLNQLCPGTYTFTWDGTVNRTSYPTNNIAPAGLYTFDITVNGKTPNGLVLSDDKDRMRSSALKIGDHDVVMIDSDKYRVSYVLNDTRDAFQAGVDAYDPDLQLLTGIKAGTAKSPTINTADMDVQTEVWGTYKFVFWAIDDHRELDKAHRRKPSLEVNTYDNQKPAANCWATMARMFLKEISTEEGAGYATKYQKMCGYTNWTYYGTTLGIPHWIRMPQTLKVSSALDVIRALRRVAVFSWYLHDYGNGSDGGLVNIGDTMIAPNLYYIDSLVSKGFSWRKDQSGAVYLKPPGEKKEYRVYLIGDLDGLWHITCALLINCTGNEGEGTKKLVDAFCYQGANWTGAIYGGVISVALVNGTLKKEGIGQYFWKLLAEGNSFDAALEATVRHINDLYVAIESPSHEDVKSGKYKSYSLYRCPCRVDPYNRRDPYGNGGQYLRPARGGRSKEELKRMGDTP